jgi:hypothetical protein
MMSLGTCRLVMPRSESTMARAGPLVGRADVRLDGRPLLLRQLRIGPARRPAVVRVHAQRSSTAPCFAKTSRRRPARVAEEDGVRDLHHGGLQVEREEDSPLPGVLHLLLQELTSAFRLMKVASSTSPAFSGRESFSTVTVPVRRHVLDAGGGGGAPASRIARCSGSRPLPWWPRGSSSPGGHAFMRGGFEPGELLHRARGPPVRVPLSQHRVHGAPLHPVVPGPDVPLLVGGGLVRVVGERVPLRLELRDARLQLGHRGADVRQLDDVRLGRSPPGGPARPGRPGRAGRSPAAPGRPPARARPGRCPASPPEPRGSGEGPDHRQEGVGGQGGGLRRSRCRGSGGPRRGRGRDRG